jgi:hypothetical protein
MVAGYVYSVAVVIARWSQPIRSKTSFFCFFFLLALAVDGLHRCKDRMYLVSSKYTQAVHSLHSLLSSLLHTYHQLHLYSMHFVMMISVVLVPLQ